MQIHKKIIHLLAIALVISIASLDATAEDKIKIGVSAPLTGDAALYGADIRDSIIFANERLANGRYKLVIEDDHCSEKSAVAVAQKFVAQKVSAVIGFGCSGALLGAAPVYEKNKLPAIASATGAPAISAAGDYIFRTIPSLNVAAEKLFKYASGHFSSVGIISEESAYCQGLKKAFIEANTKNSLTLSTEEFLPDTVDFRPILLRLKSKNPQALFLNPQTEIGLVRLKTQLNELHWNPALLATYYPGSPTYLKAFGDAGDGIVYADLPLPAHYLTAAGLKLYSEYQAEYGSPKSGDYNIILSILAFEAIDQALLSGQDIHNYLYTQRFKNLVNDFGFDKSGDLNSDKITFVLKIIKNSKPVALELE